MMEIPDNVQGSVDGGTARTWVTFVLPGNKGDGQSGESGEAEEGRKLTESGSSTNGEVERREEKEEKAIVNKDVERTTFAVIGAALADDEFD